MSSQYFEIQKKLPLHQFLLEKAPFTRNIAIYDVYSNKKFHYHQLPYSVFNFGKNLLTHFPSFKKGTKVAVHIRHDFSMSLHMTIYLGTCAAGGCTSFIDPTAQVKHKNDQLKCLENEILITSGDIFEEKIIEGTPVKYLIFVGPVPQEKLELLEKRNIEAVMQRTKENPINSGEEMKTYIVHSIDKFLKSPPKKVSEENPPGTGGKMKEMEKEKEKEKKGTRKEISEDNKDAIVVSFDIFNDVVSLPFNARNVKCVKFDHSNVLFNLIQLATIKEVSSKDVVLINYPHFHIFTFLMLFLCLSQGAKVICLPFNDKTNDPKKQFNAKNFAKIITSNKVTKCYLHILSILRLYTNIRKSGDIQDLPTLKSITCLGPRVSRVIQAELSERMKVDIKNCYGYVETQFLSFQLDDQVKYKANFNPVGKLLPGTKVRIIDSQTSLLPTGKVGDIAIFGPQCGHYFGEREYKWYKTGDAGMTDQKNHLFVIDQITSRFFLKPHVFYANELKDLLLAHKEIIDAEVINDSGLIKGYLVKIPQLSSSVSEMEMIEYVVRSLKENETYKIINQIQFVLEIPRDCCGYVEKNKLKKLF